MPTLHLLAHGPVFFTFVCLFHMYKIQVVCFYILEDGAVKCAKH